MSPRTILRTRKKRFVRIIYVIYFLTWTETSEVAMVLEAIALPTWPCKQITNMQGGSLKQEQKKNQCSASCNYIFEGSLPIHAINAMHYVVIQGVSY